MTLGFSVAAIKVAASLLLLAAGFRAVSDDDYARIVIAQRFAEAPALDPSGTSWLPLPFWVYGSAFALFGNELGVARAVAVALGAWSALLVYVAARWAGANRAGATAAGLCSALFPWSLWLGAAPLPEAPAAGLIALGVTSLVNGDYRRRSFGALALAAACFCRYEAWPVAAVFAAFSFWDARRERKAQAHLPAVIAIAPIALWLLHGAVRHGDALFFWKRVASYRTALGEGPPLAERLAGIPVALVREEPALIVALLFLLPALADRRRYGRPLVAAVALVAFLWAGELGGGGPTHHAGRALLSVWFLTAIALGDSLGQRFERRAWGWAALPLVAIAGEWALRGPVLADFARRDAALQIGTRARELGAPALLIDTPDFAHLAVTAAFGRPSRAETLDDRDPRNPRSSNPFFSSETLRTELARRPPTWLVASRRNARVALGTGRLRAENDEFILVDTAH